MTILEITHLKILNQATTTPQQILTCLTRARTLIATHAHDTKSQFYQSITDSSSIFLLGRWPSEQAHNDFLAGPWKEMCLGEQEALMGFMGGRSVCFADGDGVSGLLKTGALEVLRVSRRELLDFLIAEGVEKIMRRGVLGSAVVLDWGQETEGNVAEAEGEGVAGHLTKKRLHILGWESVDAQRRFRESLDEENEGDFKEYMDMEREVFSNMERGM